MSNPIHRHLASRRRIPVTIATALGGYRPGR